MIITKENDTGIETYRLVQTDDGWYWQIEVKPYSVKDIKMGITRPYQTRASAMKAIAKKIVAMEPTKRTRTAQDGRKGDKVG